MVPRLRRALQGAGLLLAAFCLLQAPAVYACGCGSGSGCTACVCGCGGNGGGLNPGSASLGPYNAKGVELLAQLPLATIGGAGKVGSAIWGWADPLTRREYALYGLSNGTSFIDVTDPRAPVYLGRLPSASGESVWRELQAYGNYLYVVSDGNGAHGMQVFDLTRLRGITAPLTFSADALYTGVANVHTLSINPSTGFAYLNGSNRAQHIVSLADPLQPAAVSDYNADGYTHDALVVSYAGPDARYRGREIAFNSLGGNGLAIVDFTDKGAPARLAKKGYPNLGYTHQGWLTEDQRFLVANDEFDENNNKTDPNMRTRTHLWDVRDLQNPRYLGAFLHDTRAIDHNLFIRGNQVYMSNYTSGLRVFDLSNLAAVADGLLPLQQALVPVAHFDTYPQDDNNPEISFNGQWGNYPFLPSGTILAGDRNNGLFVLSVAPEPGTLGLLALGAVCGVGGRIGRRRRR